MNEKAVEALTGALEVCREHLFQIEGEIDDHLGVSPEMVTWATVGDAQRLQHDLAETVDWLGTRAAEQLPVVDRLRAVLQRIAETPEARFSLGRYGITKIEELVGALAEIDGTMTEAEGALRAALEEMEGPEKPETEAMADKLADLVVLAVSIPSAKFAAEWEGREREDALALIDGKVQDIVDRLRAIKAEAQEEVAEPARGLPKPKSLAERLADLVEFADSISTARQIVAEWGDSDGGNALAEHDDGIDDLVKRLQALANLAQSMEVADG